MDDKRLSDVVATYAAWVRALRTADPLPPLFSDTADPLQRLSDELVLLEHTLAKREQELSRLLDVVTTIGAGVRLDDVLRRVFAGFRGLIPYERIGCAFLRDNGRLVEAEWAASDLGPVQIQRGYRQPMAGSSLETILDTGQPRIINDLVAYLEAKPTSDSTRRIVKEGGRSNLTCPLILDGVPLGFLFFTSQHPHAYSPDHQLTFRQIAGQVAAVIHKSHAYEQLLTENRTLVAETHRLQIVATSDPLTGLLNRRAIDAVLGQAEQRLQHGGDGYGVIMCDIDHFKAVNDTYGHAAGDLVLTAVAQRLAQATRKVDVLGRVGGEEFMVVANGATTLDNLAALAERLRRAVADAPVDLKETLFVTASFGVAMATSAEPATQVTQRADDALYLAKREGRNRVVSAA